MTYIHQMLVSKELGGAGLIGIHIANCLREKGKEYCLWLPGEGAALSKIQQLALKYNVYDASCITHFSKTKAVIGNWKINRRFYRYRPGIVHIHSPYHYKVLRTGLQAAGLKMVVHVHLQEPEEALRWAFRKPPDVIVTCAKMLTEHVRYTLPERYQEQQKIVSIPNAVDIGRFHPGDKVAARRLIGISPSVPIALMAANLAPHKGQETAIKAIATLKDSGIDVVCWIAGIERDGRGAYTAHLQELCNAVGVADRVCFLGHRDDVPDLLRAADVFLLPSTSEGLPLSLLEAQATKVPVLAAPTAGIPDVIADGETGFLIPAENALGYAQRITTLLHSPEIARRVTERAYTKIIREHHWATYCMKVWGLYHSLMEEE